MINETFNEKKLVPGAEKQRFQLNSIFWGCIVVWSGLVILARVLGWLAPLVALDPGSGSEIFGRLDATWSLIFLGAGVIFLIAAAVRWLAPAYRRSGDGNLVLGVILIGIGIGDLFNWVFIWPILLLCLGATFLLRGFQGRPNR